MTNEEAIKRLKEARKTIQPFLYVDEAIDYAIKALEQQTCEDCISREAVDNYIVKLMSGYLYDEERARLEDLTAYIWELPSVTPSYNSVKTELEPCEDWKFYYKHGYAQAKRDLLCDDCISRTELLNSLKGFEILHNHDELRTNLIYGIMNLPSVTLKGESDKECDNNDT